MNLPAGQPTRREREASRHRAEILDVAEHLLGEKGYFATTMEEVARRAEFAVGSIYKFFKSKEELFMAVMFENANYIEPRAYAAIAAGETSRARIGNYIQARIDMFWEKPCFYRVFFVEIMGGMLGASPGLSEELQRRYQGFLAALSQEIERGIAAGEFVAAPPALLTALLEGHVRGYLTFVSYDLTRPRSRECEPHVVESFLKGIAR